MKCESRRQYVKHYTTQKHARMSLTLVPRRLIRGRWAAKMTPFSLTVTDTFRKVPPLPHFGQNILPISGVTLLQAWHFKIQLWERWMTVIINMHLKHGRTDMQNTMSQPFTGTVLNREQTNMLKFRMKPHCLYIAQSILISTEGN